MKYLLTFVVDEASRLVNREHPTPEDMKVGIEAWAAFDREAVERGALIACEPLENSTEATTLHLNDRGEPLVTDGPFAESKEQLGGFALLECADHEEALEWARKVPMQAGAIEVRAVMDLSRFGYESRTVPPARPPVTS